MDTLLLVQPNVKEGLNKVFASNVVRENTSLQTVLLQSHVHEFKPAPQDEVDLLPPIPLAPLNTVTLPAPATSLTRHILIVSQKASPETKSRLGTTPQSLSELRLTHSLKMEKQNYYPLLFHSRLHYCTVRFNG